MDEGSRDEYGFETTRAALDPSGVNSSVKNLRRFGDCILFDEDEQSDVR